MLCGTMINKKKIDKIIEGVEARLGESDFFSQVYSEFVRYTQKPKKDPLCAILTKPYDQFSKRLDSTQIQESCSVRNVLKARRLSSLLLQEDGKIDEKALCNAIKILQENLYPLGPERHHDYKRNEHMLRVLELLQEKEEVKKAFLLITKPFGNPSADLLIRETLQLDPKAVIKDRDARAAVLSAWLVYLRQNVGSCFATAPAIIVHDEQPLQFLRDMKEILETGKLVRTFSGEESAAPLCPSWGAADLRKPFLFHPDQEKSPIPIHLSPGIIVALTRVGVLDQSLSVNERAAQCKEKIENAFVDFGPTRFMDAEQLIRCLILFDMDLTEEDFNEFASRPKAMMNQGVVATRSSGLSAKIRECNERLDLAYSGFKSLTDNALLKSWEFTVASFAEVKPSLSRYNMYHSLGLGAEDQGGIGQALYQALQEKIDRLNEEVEEFQHTIEQFYMLVKHAEGRLRRASQHEGEYLKREYQNRLQELRYQESLRDQAHTKAHRFANLFSLLMDLYDEKFREYFQEVYDPDIREVQTGPYDDSPAGFRLLYKGGRSLITSQWEKITGPQEFAEALARFFIATEREIVHNPICEGIQQEVTSLITALVNFVKTDAFLESALYRMALAYQERPVENPLQNLDKVTKKPWVYTSGGTMGSLVGAYFGVGDKPDEVDRWVDSEEELLAFFVDTLKGLTKKAAKELDEGKVPSFLMHSPTHAFCLKPYRSMIEKGWRSQAYTYTWLKDDVMLPGQRFIDQQNLDDAMVQHLLGFLQRALPREMHHFFHKAFYRVPKSMHAKDFRSMVMGNIRRQNGLHYGNRPAILPDDIDCLLYDQLPIIRSYELRNRVEQVTKHALQISDEQHQEIMQVYDALSDRLGKEEVIGAKQVREVIQATLLLYLDRLQVPFPFLQSLVSAIRHHNWMSPQPLVFGDTNWVKEDFALLVGPSTAQLELWLVEPLGLRATPISSWKCWVDGSRKDRTWGIYTNPFQYRTW